MAEGVSWILVDVGNVLIAFDPTRIFGRLVDECFPVHRRTLAERTAIERFVLGDAPGSSPERLVDRGAKDLAWLRDLVNRQFGVDAGFGQFEDIWCSTFAERVNENVVACVDGLRAKGIRIGVCSNTNAAHWNFLRCTYPEVRRLADSAHCFLSFEMGVGKGDDGFFEQIADMTHAPPANHLLLDDKHENCAAARAAGMRAVVFDPAHAAESLARVMNSFPGGAVHDA